MSISKKDLYDLKSSLKKNDPNAINNIKSRRHVILANENNSDFKNKTRKKSVIKWNFNVNDLVEISINKHVSNINNDTKIGIIISDYIYHSAKVEKNNFFVLVENNVLQFEGSHLRKL